MAYVLVAVVGLDAQQRDLFLGEAPVDLDRLVGEGVAELEVVVDHAVRIPASRQRDDVVQPLVVRREAGAVRLELAVGDGCELPVDGAVIRGCQIVEVAGARAGFLADDDGAAFLQQLVELPVGDGHRDYH